MGQISSKMKSYYSLYFTNDVQRDEVLAQDHIKFKYFHMLIYLVSLFIIMQCAIVAIK